MASRKVTLDGLDAAIKAALAEYEQDVSAGVDVAVKTVAQYGAKALRSESLAKFRKKTKLHNGRYGTGWSYQIQKGRLNTTGVIFNKKYPGIPHLQEHGHAKRGGGRSTPIEHIAPVEAQVQKLAVEEVMKRL